MKFYPKRLLIITLSVLLAGCSGAAENTSAERTKTEAGETIQATEITWEDLMPEGEDELLETLYLEFYEEFERKMSQNSTTLAEAASQETDVSMMIAEGSEADSMDQIGTFNVVNELNGKRVRVPGYVVPFDFNAESEYTEFLLVPYFGACLHTPPPPPNQIILVKTERASS